MKETDGVPALMEINSKGRSDVTQMGSRGPVRNASTAKRKILAGEAQTYDKKIKVTRRSR